MAEANAQKEAMAATLWEFDNPDCSWAEWVEYADQHKTFRPQVERYRDRAAAACAALAPAPPSDLVGEIARDRNRIRIALVEAAGYPASYAKHAQDWDRYPLSVIEKAILSLLPNGVSVREECAKAENLRHRLRMIVSHATGGQDMPEDASVNDICVEITRVRNTVYQAGKDSASPLSTLEGEGH